MPLFVKKDRYVPGDMIVFSDVSLETFRVRVGTCYRTSAGYLRWRSKWSYLRLLTGQTDFKRSGSGGGFNDRDICPHGVVAGSLDLEDWYEVRQYLKAVCTLVYPMYHDHLFNRGMALLAIKWVWR